MNPSELLRSYRIGLGFRPDDVLKPKPGIRPVFEVVDDTVVVLSQDPFSPHTYIVVGERLSYRTPAQRYIKFDVNGHDWEKVGRA